ncbi:MAG: prolyl oligopeptidase family serine peptidase [Eubacteriales bacterium]
MFEKCKWQNKDATRQSFNYLKYTPDGYDEKSDEKWPFIVFLHGSGERGDNIDIVWVNGPFRFENCKEKPNIPFFMVSPQCPDNRIWGNFTESLNEFLDDMLKELPVDPDRVYLTGLSMGGTGAWNWGMENPERFAAMAPVCGTGIYWYAGILQNMPLWAFHGEDDDVVPLSESVDMVDAINKNGGKAKITVYKGVGHGSYMNAYATQELYDWFLTHKKS